MEHKDFPCNNYINKRNRNQKYYHQSNGRKQQQIYYLKKTNNISTEELKACETIEEKLEYCRLVHIRNKYGITVKDIDDNSTEVSVC